MSDYLYPECPNCGNKASRGRGVGVYEVVNQPFKWKCAECKMTHRGRFNSATIDVTWVESRKGVLESVFEKLRFQR